MRDVLQMRAAMAVRPQWQAFPSVQISSVHRSPGDCSHQAADLINQCLEIEPHLRPTAKELVIRLEELSDLDA